MLKTVASLNIFVETRKSLEEQHLFEMEIFLNIRIVFTIN